MSSLSEVLVRISEQEAAAVLATVIEVEGNDRVEPGRCENDRQAGKGAEEHDDKALTVHRRGREMLHRAQVEDRLIRINGGHFGLHGSSQHDEHATVTKPNVAIATKVRNARLVNRRLPVSVSSECTSTSTSIDVLNVQVTCAFRMIRSPTLMG